MAYSSARTHGRKNSAVAWYNHYKRISSPAARGCELNKSNILLIGYRNRQDAARTNASRTDFPCDRPMPFHASRKPATSAKTSKTHLKAAGSRSRRRVQKASKAIIYIDEIDKYRKKRRNLRSPRCFRLGRATSVAEDVWKARRQRASSGGRTPIRIYALRYDQHVCFICGGAFVRPRENY